MQNIERFDAYALYILGHLYTDFPVAKRLDNTTIRKAVGLPIATEAAEADIIQGTIDWLRVTGFLLASDEQDTRDTLQFKYVLAPKAFDVLRQELPVLVKPKGKQEAPKPFGQKVIEFGKGLGKTMATEAGKKAAEELMSSFIRLVAGPG